MSTSFKTILTAAAVISLSVGAMAQSGFFTKIDGPLPSAPRVHLANFKKTTVLRFDEARLRDHLLHAPLERSGLAGIPLEVPLPDGSTETFDLFESSNLSPEIAAEHPNIKTYCGNGQRRRSLVLRMNLTELGLSAVVLNVAGSVACFEPFPVPERELCLSYLASEAVAPEFLKKSECRLEDIAQEPDRRHRPAPATGRNNTGGTLRTYRLAMAADGEFTQKFGNGTQSGGLAALTNYVNTSNAIFRNDLCIHLTLVSGTNLVYTNPATDPYSNVETDMLEENQTNVDAVVGSTNYDVAHVLGFDADYGSGGGVAQVEGACYDPLKAQGASIVGEGYGQVFYDQLVAHELGHQFGMNHSYNSTIPVCTSRHAATSVEPGAGCTIMSYGFTCNTDDYFSSTSNGPVLNFHAKSFEEVEIFIATPGYGDCFTTVSTGNSAPVVTMPGAFTVPKSTPFSLTGAGNTPGSGDSYTYSWESNDVGAVAPDAATLGNTAEPPFFRTYAPTSWNTRNFPLLSAILDGTNQAVGDKLPSVSTTLHQRLTLRDNNASGGGAAYGDVNITVDGSLGPFLVTSNLSGTYQGNSSQTVTWSVNGTSAATPNVKISLSTDGGTTFATTLAASTPNDGSQSVTLPNVATSTARLKVEAVGNIFFDISNSNFTIQAALPIEVVRFSAKAAPGTATALEWETGSEADLDGFDIEWMEEGGEWTTVGFVAAKNRAATYGFLHKTPRLGENLYRLKSVGRDGGFSFSPVEAVRFDGHQRPMSVSPNPAADWLFFSGLEVEGGELSVRVSSVAGQVAIGETPVTAAALDISALPSGAYFVELMGGGKREVFRFVKK